MAGKPPLRAVQAGEKAPAPRKKRAPAKARTLAHAAKLSRKTYLETLRDKIATAMDDPRAHPRDVGNLAKQLEDVMLKLEQLKPQKAGAVVAPQTAVVNTPDEHWDEDAI